MERDSPRPMPEMTTDPPRIVSLLPAATEIVAALGLDADLVGRTHECDWPPSIGHVRRVTASAVAVDDSPGRIDAAVRELSMGGEPLFTLDEAAIANTRPELILTQRLCDVCAVSEMDVRALALRLEPAPRVVTLAGSTLDGVFDDIAGVAAAAGVAERGAALIESLRGRLRSVHLTLQAAAAPRPRVAVIEWTDPLYAAGHWVPEMVRRAGGVDVLAKAGEHSRHSTTEAVREADPEIVLVAPCGVGLARAASEARVLLARADWEWTRGSNARAVWAIDANAYVSRPGPRLIDGVELMARIFNPALFTPLDVGHAERIA